MRSGKSLSRYTANAATFREAETLGNPWRWCCRKRARLHKINRPLQNLVLTHTTHSFLPLLQILQAEYNPSDH